MAEKIGPNHGAEIFRTMMHELHPDLPEDPNFAIDSVWGETGKVYDPETYPGKKATGTIRKLAQGHDEVWGEGGLAARLAALEADPPFLRAPGSS